MAAYVAGRSGWIHSPRRAGREHRSRERPEAGRARARIRARRADASAPCRWVGSVRRVRIAAPSIRRSASDAGASCPRGREEVDAEVRW